MEIRVSKNRLERYLKEAEVIASKKLSETHSLMLVEVTDGVLALTTTDLERGYRVEIQLEEPVTSDTFCVPCKLFANIVKSFPSEELLLKREDSKLLIFSHDMNTLFELNVAPSEDFPKVPTSTFGKGSRDLLRLKGHTLQELIYLTSFSASKDETYYALGGIFFEPLADMGVLRAVASDGHRLAMVDRIVEGVDEVNWKEGFIIPRKSAELMADIAEKEEEVYFGLSERYAILITTGCFFFSRVIEGSFPDYRVILRDSSDRILRVNRKTFLEAIRRASLPLSSTYKPIRFNLSASEISISSVDDVCSAVIRVDGNYYGDPLSIVFNAEYLTSALSKMNSEEVEIQLMDDKTPCILSGFRDEGYLYVVMPMVI